MRNLNSCEPAASVRGQMTASASSQKPAAAACDDLKRIAGRLGEVRSRLAVHAELMGVPLPPSPPDSLEKTTSQGLVPFLDDLGARMRGDLSRIDDLLLSIENTF